MSGGEADRRAWGDFWRSGQGGAGCLPAGLARIDAVQREVWEAFARDLRQSARVLDLATGNGAVLIRIGAVRPDLELIGVDSAPVLPDPPSGATLQPNVAMEELPFGDSSFDSVTSQFGVEYGDPERVTGEIGRVLRPAGRFRAIIHHADGPILAHNRMREAGLRWAACESGLIEHARAFARSRGSDPVPTPPAFREGIEEARRLHPGRPVAGEFATAILHTLELGRGKPVEETLDVLGTLEDRAGNELARIESLARAVCDAEALERLRAGLDAANVLPAPPRRLHEPGSDRPFAWLLDGLKR